MLPAPFVSAEQSGDAPTVMIGSDTSRVAGPISGAYSTAKHGLVGLSGSLRGAELAPFNIKVILIKPGTIATPIWQRGSAVGLELPPRQLGGRRPLRGPSTRLQKMADRGDQKCRRPYRRESSALP